MLISFQQVTGVQLIVLALLAYPVYLWETKVSSRRLDPAEDMIDTALEAPLDAYTPITDPSRWRALREAWR